MYIENIVIGTPIDSPEELLSSSISDWIYNEKAKTLFTQETFLPRILAYTNRSMKSGAISQS